jgi:hypothetical protein
MIGEEYLAIRRHRYRGSAQTSRYGWPSITCLSVTAAPGVSGYQRREAIRIDAP